MEDETQNRRCNATENRHQRLQPLEDGAAKDANGSW
jgi:hypothetical protein